MNTKKKRMQERSDIVWESDRKLLLWNVGSSWCLTSLKLSHCQLSKYVSGMCENWIFFLVNAGAWWIKRVSVGATSKRKAAKKEDHGPTYDSYTVTNMKSDSLVTHPPCHSFPLLSVFHIYFKTAKKTSPPISSSISG